jgi:hypothetical protein
MILHGINSSTFAHPVITPVVVIMPKQEDRSSLLPKIDFVHITSAARARSMKLEGLNVAQIALAMGLNTNVIWAFLQMPPMESATFPVNEAP